MNDKEIQCQIVQISDEVIQAELIKAPQYEREINQLTEQLNKLKSEQMTSARAIQDMNGVKQNPYGHPVLHLKEYLHPYVDHIERLRLRLRLLHVLSRTETASPPPPPPKYSVSDFILWKREETRLHLHLRGIYDGAPFENKVNGFKVGSIKMRNRDFTVQLVRDDGVEFSLDYEADSLVRVCKGMYAKCGLTMHNNRDENFVYAYITPE